MTRTAVSAKSEGRRNRRGAAVVDYMLAIGVVLPLMLIAIPAARRMMQLIFELSCTMVAWPFM
ncbi:MAG: hypothetical protein DWQ34_21080 [Planctomycetota bacterium]|nr:MAG: hypothetical protein DWQ29_09515 [Planctomycetota bacterium]REJ88882.1 MAG: hypothetical protein DWQ34_21080 [Planctomycetota bacterium]REK21278.1 MAG: hypothetical protein DWQ41_21990 [Planctomycetota bacterium]REK32071.1 MAG: hypothetical protein DWQ45_18080 [Planctomycetota bacterium]